jgi:hypothetical protein
MFLLVKFGWRSRPLQIMKPVDLICVPAIKPIADCIATGGKDFDQFVYAGALVTQQDCMGSLTCSFAVIVVARIF